MYDLIGDIHGYAAELVQLLELLGYEKSGESYRHPERHAIFLGDFIDRGPKIREVLEIVRPMVEEGHALAVMGNHEMNALAFHTAVPNKPDTILRKRSTKNIRQHAQTILQLTDKELSDALDWFRTLPLWLDLDDGIRAVHACWDDKAITTVEDGLKQHGGVTTSFLESACQNGHPLYALVEIILKGKEVELPEGRTFRDKDQHERREIRIRWYLPPEGHTYRTYALTNEIDLDLELHSSVVDAAAPYPPDEKPVFVGHYWLSADKPTKLADNVACLDYSVAKGGFLCAYRWNGELKLRNENFVWMKGG